MSKSGDRDVVLLFEVDPEMFPNLIPRAFGIEVPESARAIRLKVDFPETDVPDLPSHPQVARTDRDMSFLAGYAIAITRILKHRGLPIDWDLLNRSLDCTRFETLDAWLERAITAKSAREVLGE